MQGLQLFYVLPRKKKTAYESAQSQLLLWHVSQLFWESGNFSCLRWHPLTCDGKFFIYISVMKYNIIYLQTSFFLSSYKVFSYSLIRKFGSVVILPTRNIFCSVSMSFYIHSRLCFTHIKCISFCYVTVPFCILQTFCLNAES